MDDGRGLDVADRVEGAEPGGDVVEQGVDVAASDAGDEVGRSGGMTMLGGSASVVVDALPIARTSATGPRWRSLAVDLALL